MNYATIYKKSCIVVCGCLLIAGQQVLPTTLIEEQQSQEQVSTSTKFSTLKKKVFSTTGAIVVLGLWCCGMTYVCWQLHSKNAALNQEVGAIQEDFTQLSLRSDNQLATINALGETLTDLQYLMGGRLTRLESALLKKNNRQSVQSEDSLSANLNEWSTWFGSTGSGTHLPVSHDPVVTGGLGASSSCNTKPGSGTGDCGIM